MSEIEPRSEALAAERLDLSKQESAKSREESHLQVWCSRTADLIDAGWRVARDTWSLIRVTQFGVLGVVIYAALLWTDQGVDSALIFIERPWSCWLLVSYFALQTWQWSRLMVTYRYLPIDRRDIDDRALSRMSDAADADIARRTERLATSLPDSIESLEQVRELVRLKVAQAHLRTKARIIDERNAALHGQTATVRLRCSMLWLPRLLGIAVYGAMGVTLFLAKFRYATQLTAHQELRLISGAWLMLIAGAAFGCFVAYRRALTRALQKVVVGPAPLDPALGSSAQLAEWARTDQAQRISHGTGTSFRRMRQLLGRALSTESSDEVQRYWRWHRFSDLRMNTRAWLVGWGAVSTVALAWAVALPGHFERVGPVGALVFTLSFWIMAGSLWLWLLDHRRVPVLALLLLWAAFVSRCATDHHPVRVLAMGTTLEPNNAMVPMTSRPSLQSAVHKYLGKRPVDSTPIVVATAGGGIRAAYFTALALATLDAQNGRAFYDNLFGVSAVSGGALGAAAYLAASRQRPVDGPGIQEGIDRFMAHDFLAPTVATFLSSDLLYGLLPLPMLPDRARTLERAWERAWDRAFPGSAGTFSQGYSSLFRGVDHIPALVINGTLVQTGERLLTSPFSVEPSSSESPRHRPFGEARDFFASVGNRDVALSTAIHNGARFPFVSPAGALIDATGKYHGQVVDGGYFENFGADTARELLQAIDGAHDGASARHLKPIVIQISSDPNLTADPARAPSPSPARSSWQLTAPLDAYAKTRDARGARSMLELQTLTERLGGLFVHIRLCRVAGQGDPPLGWVLSSAAQDAIKRQLSPANSVDGESNCEHNVNELARVKARLAHPPTP